MRQALIPRSWHAHLRGAVFRGKTRNGMHVFCCCRRAEEFRLLAVVWMFVKARLDPDFINFRTITVCEKTYAVTGRHNFIKDIAKSGYRQVFKDKLPHVEARNKLEFHIANPPQCPQPHNRCKKPFAVFFPRNMSNAAVRTY